MSYMKPSETTKPHLIIMVGIPCSGKSFFADHFSDTFNAPLVSIDVLRKKLFSNHILGENEEEILRKVTDYVLDEVLKTQRTVIFEGETGQREDRAGISKKAIAAGYEPLFIWVQTETATARKRAVKANTKKPPISTDEFDAKLKAFNDPLRNEKAIVISGKHTYASQLKIVLKHLVQPRINDNESIKPVIQPRSRNFLIR